MGFCLVITSENPGYFDRKTKKQTNKNKNKASSPLRENSLRQFLHFPTYFKNELYKNFESFEPLHLPKKSVGFLLLYPTPTDRRKSLIKLQSTSKRTGTAKGGHSTLVPLTSLTLCAKPWTRSFLAKSFGVEISEAFLPVAPNLQSHW